MYFSPCSYLRTIVAKTRLIRTPTALLTIKPKSFWTNSIFQIRHPGGANINKRSNSPDGHTNYKAIRERDICFIKCSKAHNILVIIIWHLTTRRPNQTMHREQLLRLTELNLLFFSWYSGDAFDHEPNPAASRLSGNHRTDQFLEYPLIRRYQAATIYYEIRCWKQPPWERRTKTK